ncbi:MAG: cyclic nucleotide-binding domain-containing protein [Alphaproteobacteria bacterium]|nr:cyclic nucleotide-binding domain-containing protein [Alphaproteobacteria bacterium]
MNEIQNYSAKERIINKDDPADKAYMIKSGSVRVFLEDGTKTIDLATLKEGDIFGETAIFEGGTYGANVEADEDCKLLVITPESLKEMLESANPVMRAMLEMLIKRLKNTNEALLKSETREFMDIALI